MQHLTVVIPKQEQVQKEGEMGRRRLNQYTRYGCVILSMIQAFFIARWLEGNNRAYAQYGQVVLNPGWGFRLLTMVSLTTGTAFIMWLGEQITERGIGNGMSLLIFTGIVVGLPRGIADLYEKVRTNAWGQFTVPAMVILIFVMIAVVAFIVYVERSERRVPMQFAKKMVGRRMMGGQSSYLPLRVNSGGVMPVIFASSILSFPAFISNIAFVKNNRYFSEMFNAVRFGEPLYTLLYAVGIVFFAYFYVSIVFNPNEVADNMRRGAGFVPGIRPGKR